MLINWSLIAGYDFFISYRRNEASQYAARLEQMLKQADFRCFLDDKDASAGTPLTSRLRSALRRSKVLIVIGSANIAESMWVAEEVAIFAKTRRDIIPINIAGGLKLAYERNQAFSVLQERDLLWLDEEASLDSGPSPAILGGLQKGFRHRRANRNLRLLGGAVVVVLAVSAITAYWQKLQADHARDQAIEASRVAADERDYARAQEAIAKQQRDIANDRLQLAESQAFASDARREMIPELKNALTMSVEAYEKSPSIDAQMALLETLSRAAKIKRYFACNRGEKATGVVLSKGDDPLIAYSCFTVGATHIWVVDMKGRIRGHASVSGDGRAFAFLDRDHLAIGGSRDLRIFSIARGGIHAYPGHSAIITTVASGLDTQVFSADSSGEVRVWKRNQSGPLATNSEVVTKVTSGQIAHLIYSANTGTLHIVGYDDAVTNIPFKAVPDSDPNLIPGPRNALVSDCVSEHPPGTRYLALAFAIDGSAYAYSTESNDIIVVDGMTRHCEAVLSGHTHNILAMAFSADAKELASAGAIADADDTHGVILWDLGRVHPLAKRLTLAKTALRFDSKIALSGDGTSWACTYCETPLVWDGIQVHFPTSVDADAITSIALAPDGKELIVGFKEGLLMFIQKPVPFRFVLRSASTSSIDKLWFADELYAITASGQVSIWSAGRRVNASLFKGVPKNECLDASTWEPYLPLENDGQARKTIALYDLRDGSLQSTVLPPTTGDACSSLAFIGENGPVLRLSLEYAPIYLVTTEGRPQITSWENPVRAPSGLRSVLGLARVSRDGKRLFASSNGNAMVLFDLASKRLIAGIDLHLLHNIEISRDGTRVLTASEEGVLMWDFNPDDWKRAAIDIAGDTTNVDRR